MVQVTRLRGRILHEGAIADGTALRVAVRALIDEQRHDEAWRLLRPLLVGSAEASVWELARTLVRRGATSGWTPDTERQIRLAVLCTYEGAELAAHLELACRVSRVDAALYTGPFGQLEQEILDPQSGLARFEPTHILIAPTTFDLDFPQLAENGSGLLEREESRWQRLWDAIATSFGARIVQHSFVVPDESPFGHLASRLPGSRVTLVRELNRGWRPQRGQRCSSSTASGWPRGSASSGGSIRASGT